MNTVYGIYDRVEIAPYAMTILQEFEIIKGADSHDSAVIKGIISEGMLFMYESMIGSSDCITLTFWQEEKKQLLFSGFLDEIKVCEEGFQKRVRFKLSGLTKALDRTKKWIDYQAEDKKKSGLIQNTMLSYKNISYEDCCKDKNIPEFLLQYEESDYEFIRRILSADGEKIYTAMEGKQGRIHFGSPQKAVTAKLAMTDYRICFDKHLQYGIESQQFFQMGDRIDTPMGSLIVEKACHSLKKGKSENHYRLCREQDFTTDAIYNPQITGISLDGTIKDRKRDKVKIELDMTPEAGEKDRRWFSYSSVASSNDGSGWYCMPEVGEEIRLFLPTDKERDAYVISAIRSDSGGYASNGGGAREPSNKSLSNVQGQEVNFTSDGVTLNCAGNVTSMSLTKDGEINITATEDIEITSDKLVSFRAEQGIIIKAKDKIKMQNEAGGSLEITDHIDINANRIKNNC